MGFRDAQGNLTGSHRIGNTRYDRGAVIESEEPLDELFRNKFFRVGNDIPTSQGTMLKRKGKSALTASKPEAVVGKGREGVPSTPSLADSPLEQRAQALGLTGKPDTTSKHGMDVTDEFGDAELAKMKVFLNPKTDSYIIVDPESNEILKRVKTDKLVKKFLKSQLG
jgi:hypothetical protein